MGYKSKCVNLQIWSQFPKTGPWPNEISEISEDKDAPVKGASPAYAGEFDVLTAAAVAV